jgi:Flp pilus assembly protein TadG
MPADFLRRFGRDRRANVAVIFALSLIPAIFLIGMGLDFSSAIQKRSALNAATDAAALATVTPSMMTQSSSAAQTAATNIFKAEASNLSGLTYSGPTVTITSSNGGLTRTTTVCYGSGSVCTYSCGTAASVNNFPNILGQSSWPICGYSTATATTAPNINFYLLLDNSPSMDLPATSAGITAMIDATENAPSSGQNANGCAFACHESNPSADDLGNPNGEDNYTLAQNLGVVTRIENMATATQDLMTTATSMESSNNTTYEMAIYTFNGSGLNTIQTLTSSLTTASNSAQNIDVLEVYDNNWLTSSNNNSDTDTNFDTAMDSINGIMPNPGTGASNSTPQEVLFLVTDGVEDKIDGTCTETTVSTSAGTRCQQPFDTTWCTTIKNRGILIAVLYTEYLPLPASGVGSNAWYTSYVAPYQSQIGPNMESCASPGLYFAVTTDGDITAAMNALFQQAVATARLSH